MSTHTVPSATPEPPHANRVALNSGLYVDAADCEYCLAWPASPCAFHRPREPRA